MKRSLCTALLLIATGCGGGKAAMTAPQPGQAAVPAARTSAQASANIFIPNPRAAASAKRSPLWVSPSTQLVDVAAANVGNIVGTGTITAVPPGAPNCSAVAGPPAGRTCTVAFPAPVGLDTITVYAYDGPDEYNGNVVSTGTQTNLTVTSTAANTFNFTLGGIVGCTAATHACGGNFPIALSPASLSVTHGTAATLTLSIQGYDTDANPIGKYDAPLTITQTDTSGAYVLSAAQILDSSLTPSISIAYNGANVPTTITVATSSADTAANFGPRKASITITPS